MDSYMTFASLFIVFAAAQTPAKINFEPTVQLLNDGSYRVEVYYTKGSVQSNANAQLKMTRLAQKTCKGRGVAIMPGPLNVDEVPRYPKIGKMSEPFTCSQDN
jgi:hypothetical protein